MRKLLFFLSVLGCASLSQASYAANGSSSASCSVSHVRHARANSVVHRSHLTRTGVRLNTQPSCSSSASLSALSGSSYIGTNLPSNNGTYYHGSLWDLTNGYSQVYIPNGGLNNNFSSNSSQAGSMNANSNTIIPTPDFYTRHDFDQNGQLMNNGLSAGLNGNIDLNSNAGLNTGISTNMGAGVGVNGSDVVNGSTGAGISGTIGVPNSVGVTTSTNPQLQALNGGTINGGFNSNVATGTLTGTTDIYGTPSTVQYGSGVASQPNSGLDMWNANHQQAMSNGYYLSTPSINGSVGASVNSNGANLSASTGVTGPVYQGPTVSGPGYTMQGNATLNNGISGNMSMNNSLSGRPFESSFDSTTEMTPANPYYYNYQQPQTTVGGFATNVSPNGSRYNLVHRSSRYSCTPTTGALNSNVNGNLSQAATAPTVDMNALQSNTKGVDQTANAGISPRAGNPPTNFGFGMRSR